MQNQYTETDKQLNRAMGADDDYDECVFATCGNPVTKWRPSAVDDELIPACDKHYNDPTITPRRWENAWKKNKAVLYETAGRKCYICGKPAVCLYDATFAEIHSRYGKIPEDHVPDLHGICWDCLSEDCR